MTTRVLFGLLTAVLVLANCGNSETVPDGGPRTDGPPDVPVDGPSVFCDCGTGRVCPEGAIFASACGVCMCQKSGFALCQAVACDGGPPEPPRCEAPPAACGRGDCVFDEGCGSPRAYCAQTQCSFTFTQTFCGCDGETFTSDCPRKPYRHVGACSPT
jgi:hypothetical protein